MTKLNPRAAGDVEEAYYRELGAGRRCLFWYSDDTVWHEALIGLVVGPEHAVIFTPDGDLYVEKISCQGEEGPARMKGLLPNLNLPRKPSSPSLPIQRGHHGSIDTDSFP